MRISIMGIPGAGKTTLATILGGMFGIVHISSGELARASGFSGTYEEKTGQLAPNEGAIRRLVKTAIGDNTSYILDGFPRTIKQIDALGIDIDVALWLKTGHYEIAIQRLLRRGRPDDTHDIIKMRLSTYFRCTHQLVGYFDNMSKLIEVDASGTIANTVSKAVLGLSKFGIIEAEKYIDRLLQRNTYGTRKSKQKPK